MKKVPVAVLIVILLVVVLLGVLLFAGNNRAKTSPVNSEKFYVGEMAGVPSVPKSESIASKASASPDSAASGIGSYSPSDPLGNEMYNPVQAAPTSAQPSCFPRDRLSADQLLPKDAANSKWAQMNPAGQGDVRDQNFLTAGYHIGVNTVGQSLRNANYQLRSEPPNPQVPVSPWNISTIEYDNSRRPLEIGGDF